MASNNYTQANVVPSSDTFREWVDLTNRMAFDMEKKVVTTEVHNVGGGTTGNAYVNGFFSANTLYIVDSIKGVKVDASSNSIGTNAAAANLSISTNTVFVNSFATVTSNTIVNAFSIAEGQFVYKANSTANQIAISTSVDEFESNATAFNVTGTTANVTSTTMLVNGTTFDVHSNVDVDNALTDITAEDFQLSGTGATVDSTTLTVSGTTADINSNVDIDNALTDITGTKINLSGTSANVESTTLTVNGTTFDIDSNVDIDNVLTDITATDLNVSGSNVTIDSTHVDIHGTTLDINSATNIDGNITTTADATIGNANSDLLTVNSNTVLTDKLDVTKDTNLQADLTVAGHTTLNGNTVVGDNINVDELKLNALVNTHILPSTNGTLSIGNTVNRWDGTFDDLVGEDITSNNTLTVTGQADFNGDVNLGDAATDTVTFVADVDSNILPSANGNDLGAATARWDLIANGVNVANHAHFNLTANVEGVATFGNDVDIASEANTGTLRVRSTSQLEGFANAVGSIGVGANAHIGGNTYIHHGNTNGQTVISDSTITVGNSDTKSVVSTGGISTNGTLDVSGASALNSTLGVGGATTLQSTLNTVGSARFQDTANVEGLLRAKAGSITTGTANATVGMNVGANVNLSTSKITVGTSTANTTITKSEIATDGALSVTTTSTLAGNVSAEANVAIGNKLAVTGTTTLGDALDVNSTADFEGNVNFQDSITVADNSTFSKTLAAGNTSITGTLSTTGKATLASANVTGALQANGAVDFNSTGDFAGNVNFQDSITVADNSTFSKTLAAGNTTVTGFINVSTTSQLDGVVTAGSDVDITGEANSATLRSRGIANVDGLLRAKSGSITTGTANTSTAIHVGSNANTKVRLANNTIAVGNAAANSKLTSTGVSTTGTLTVSNTAALGTTTITGDASVTANLTATYANVGGLNSTGAVDLDTTLNVDGATTLNGDVDLGNATSDTISYTGRVDTSIIPTANGKVLGAATKRWQGVFSSANTSGALSVGTTLGAGNTSITGTVTATGNGTIGGTLDVTDSVTVGGASANIQPLQINFGNSSINANLTANTTQTLFTADKFLGANLVITGSASLPDDTTLTAALANAVTLSVTNNANFSLGSNVDLKFGDGNGVATLNFSNAVLSNTVALNHRLQVGTFSSGGSGTGAQLNSSTLEIDNVHARSDLIGNFSSDQRLKDDIIKIDTALDKVEKVNGYQFTWNNNIDDFRAGTVDYGVIAQELENVLPHAVDINNRGYKTVNYNSLIPLLIEAIKELSGRVKELEKGDEVDG